LEILGLSREILGLRLFGVRPDGVLAHLGIENGDRIERVSGHEVSSPESALEAYAALRQAKRLVVELKRHGAPVKIVYRLE
jgi:general secretion pathway protein C